MIEIMSDSKNAGKRSEPLEAQHQDALVFISRALQVPVEVERIREAVRCSELDKSEPLEALVKAAEALGIRIQPMRMRVRDAVWMAREDQPLLVWATEEKRWVVVRRHGFFRARITDLRRPLEAESVGYVGLERLLAVGDSALVDFGFVSPERASEEAGGKGSRGGDWLAPHSEPGESHGGGHAVMSPVVRLLALLKTEKPDLWTIFVFSLVSGLLYLGLPLAMNALVSNLAFGTQSAPFQQALLVMALAVFGALLLSGLIRALQYYLVEVIQRRMFVRVASAMAYRLPRLRMESLDGVHAPELVNRFLDVVTVQKTTALLLLDGINLVLGASIGLVLLGFYHPFLLSFSVLMLLAIAGIVFGLGRGSVKTSIQESICKYDLVSWLEEIARYPRIFKGSGGYSMAMERADELCHAFLQARGAHFKILLRQILGLVVLEVVATSALLVVGGWLVLSMQITLGQLVASELIVGAIVASLPKLAKKFEAWYDALAAVDKLGHLVDLELEAEGGEVPELRAPNLGVKLVGATLTYPEGNVAFEAVDAEFAPGARVALIGPEGAGSSSLLDVLFGLRALSSGYVMVGGLDLRSWNLEELRKSVLLLRANDIVEGSVAENVRLGRRDVGLEVVQKSLEEVGLFDFVMQFSHGMHTALITGGSLLSSRQRTRLLLARALALSPRLLLIDELFDGLDTDSVEALMRVIFDPQRKWTVLVATRDPGVAERCSQKLTMGASLAEH